MTAFDKVPHNRGLSAGCGGAFWCQQGRSAARWREGREERGRASTEPIEMIIRVYYLPLNQPLLIKWQCHNII